MNPANLFWLTPKHSLFKKNQTGIISQYHLKLIVHLQLKYIYKRRNGDWRAKYAAD